MREALEYWVKRRMGRRRALFAACVTVCAVICAVLAWGVPGASAQENTHSTAIPDNTSTVWVDVEGDVGGRCRSVGAVVRAESGFQDVR